MSTLGPAARSTRAPAMPSITGRPSAGSNTPGATTGGDQRSGRPSARRRRWSGTSAASTGRRAGADAEDVDGARGCRCGRCSRRAGCCCRCPWPGRPAGWSRWRRRRARPGHRQRGRQGVAVAVAAERRPADVDVAEERAARRAVGPDLLLVREGGRGLLGDHHRAVQAALLPAAAAAARRRCGRPRWPRSPGRSPRTGSRAKFDGQVRVVQPGAVGPREGAVGARARAEGHRRVTVGDQAGLVVAGQRADRADVWRARLPGPRQSRAVQPGVGRLASRLGRR